MTTEDLSSWAQARGVRAGSADAFARDTVRRFAGRDSPSDVARALRAMARESLRDDVPAVTCARDPDGTIRFTVHLADGAVVETVAIVHPSRTTICLSSQVGCARACVFCETGRLGLERQLAAHEITGQFAAVARALSAAGVAAPTNVVFMGMGEPLDNLEHVLQAADVLADDNGFAVAARRITVSTVGIVPKMHEFYAHGRYSLAVSLHATCDDERRALLPVAAQWSVAELCDAIAASPRSVLLQWTLIAGVNDSDAHADGLIRFAQDLDVRVNVIPLNPGPLDTLRAPDMATARAFQARLLRAGVRTMVRLPHGQHVGGACGQLAGQRRR